jgi:thymidylate kinase
MHEPMARIDLAAREQGLLARVLAALRREGLRWCVLRDGADLERLAGGGEVDLLVDPEHLRRFAELTRELGFVQLRAWGHAPHHFFVGFDAERGAWLKLDVVDALSYGRPIRRLRTDLADGCLVRRHWREPAFLLSPEDELVTLLLHGALDKGEYSAGRRERMKQLCAQAADDARLSMLLERYWSPGMTGARLADLVRRDAWSELLAEGPAVAARLARERRLGTLVRGLRGRVLRRLNRWRGPGPGISVALLAPDGAGKSTLAARLAESWPLPVRTIYMGLYPARERAARLPGLSFARRLARQWGRWVAARVHQARGRLVIFDRHSYDALLHPRAPLPWPKRWRRFVLARSCPSPDLVIVLDAPGKLLWSRKREHTPAALEQQRREYLRLAARLPRATVVDASRPPDRVHAEVMERIWRACCGSGAEESS